MLPMVQTFQLEWDLGRLERMELVCILLATTSGNLGGHNWSMWSRSCMKVLRISALAFE